jgi:hypothetical protein
MSLNIGDAISAGWEKLTTTAGLQLGALYVVAVLLTGIGSQSITATLAPEMSRSTQSALAFPIGVTGGTVLLIVGLLLGAVLTVVVLRTVAHDAAELDAIPSGVTAALPKTVLFLIVAGFIQGILIGIGFVLLVIPGIFVLVSLYFTQVYIAVEGEGPLEALSSSWGLSKGDRLPIFGLVIVLGVIGVFGTILGEVVSVASPLLGSLLSLTVSGFLTIFTSGVLVDAYHQLSSDQATQDDLLRQPE